MPKSRNFAPTNDASIIWKRTNGQSHGMSGIVALWCNFLGRLLAISLTEEALDTAIEIAPEYAATMQELQKQSTL